MRNSMPGPLSIHSFLIRVIDIYDGDRRIRLSIHSFLIQNNSHLPPVSLSFNSFVSDTRPSLGAKDTSDRTFNSFVSDTTLAKAIVTYLIQRFQFIRF